MKILKYGIVIIISIIVIATISTFFMPSEWEVIRSIGITGKAEEIFPYMNNIRTWQEWSAWTTEKYPSMKVVYSGPDEGVGASQSWTGEESGSGTLTIVTSDSNKGIQYDLQFEEGKYKVDGFILLSADGSGTRVTWSNRGDVGKSPIGKLLARFMDPIMGPDLEEGLQNLKNIIEKKGR